MRIGDATERSSAWARTAPSSSPTPTARVAPTEGSVTHEIKVRVPDVDAALERAWAAGATVLDELTTYEYGERSGVVEDLAGHRWELTQSVRDVEPEVWGDVTVAPW